MSWSTEENSVSFEFHSMEITSWDSVTCLTLSWINYFLQVIINFPDPSHKSDIVQLRGPKNEVEKCTKYMQKMVADLVGDHLCLCFRFGLQIQGLC